MPVKAEGVVEIDVKDEKFKSFLDSFYKYRNAADKLPKTWAGISKENQASANAVKIMTAALFAQQDVLRSTERRTKNIQDATKSTSGYWDRVDHSTKRVANNIHSAITRFARMTGITSLITGLATGGSILGLEHLARGASQGLKSSIGLNTTYGKMNAFNLSYGRMLGDSGGFLGGIAAGRTDPTSEQAILLAQLGLTGAKGDTGDVAKQAIRAIREKAKSTDTSQLGILAQTLGTSSVGISTADLLNLKESSDSDFNKHESEYNQQQKQLDINKQLLKSWQDLDVQLGIAQKTIEKVLIESLVGLTGPLGEASKAFGELIKVLTDTGAFKWVIESITQGLMQFAEYVKKDEFKADVKKFVDSIQILADKTYNVLKFLGLLPNGAENRADIDKKERQDFTGPGADRRREERQKGYGTIGGWVDDKIKGAGSWWKGWAGGSVSSEMEAYKKVVAGNESSGFNNPYGAVNTGSGALGKYQVMPANVPSWSKAAIGHSVTPAEFLASPEIQEKVFEKIFGDSVRRHGNLADALSEWHSGVDLKTATAQGRNDGNMSTADYVKKGMSAYSKIKVDVNVNNATGGSADVSASALAANGGNP